MDNVTHSLVGLAAAKAGLERWSPLATTVCVLAANGPDSDILAAFWGGRWFYLQNHRGITHSIVGTLALALLIPTIFYGAGWLIARLRHKQTSLRFRGLLCASLIVSATHPLLDWTNNYGVRLLLPWNAHWQYGDLVFIVDPWMWLILGGAAFLLSSQTKWRIAIWTALALVMTAAIFILTLQRASLGDLLFMRVLWVAGLALIALSYRARLAKRWGRLIAFVAFSLIVAYWGALAFAHSRALVRAEANANYLAAQYGETVGRVAAMPTLANPMRWQCVFETNRATYRFDLALNEDESIARSRKFVRYEKPAGDEASLINLASADERARVLLGFARFPVTQVEGDCATQTLVQFADLRYTEPGRTERGTFSLEVPVACTPESKESK